MMVVDYALAVIFFEELRHKVHGSPQATDHCSIRKGCNARGGLVFEPQAIHQTKNIGIESINFAFKQSAQWIVALALLKIETVIALQNRLQIGFSPTFHF